MKDYELLELEKFIKLWMEKRITDLGYRILIHPTLVKEMAKAASMVWDSSVNSQKFKDEQDIK